MKYSILRKSGKQLILNRFSFLINCRIINHYQKIYVYYVQATEWTSFKTTWRSGLKLEKKNCPGQIKILYFVMGPVWGQNFNFSFELGWVQIQNFYLYFRLRLPPWGPEKSGLCKSLVYIYTIHIPYFFFILFFAVCIL